MTVTRWPGHARYGQRAGQDNTESLNANLFVNAFLGALEPYKHQAAACIFEFGTFAKKDFETPDIFFGRLEGFQGSLPKGWRYAVEIRNKDYLSSDYFALLSRHNVAHVFNAWTRMPTLAEQIALDGAFTVDFSVIDVLFRRAEVRHSFCERRAGQSIDPFACGTSYCSGCLLCDSHCECDSKIYPTKAGAAQSSRTNFDIRGVDPQHTG